MIGDRWSLLIVRDAFDGISRFSDFQRNLGLARNILASRLRDLVAHGILEIVRRRGRQRLPRVRAHREGRELFSIIVALRQWGEEHLFEEGEAPLRPARQAGRAARGQAPGNRRPGPPRHGDGRLRPQGIDPRTLTRSGADVVSRPSLTPRSAWRCLYARRRAVRMARPAPMLTACSTTATRGTRRDGTLPGGTAPAGASSSSRRTGPRRGERQGPWGTRAASDSPGVPVMVHARPGPDECAQREAPQKQPSVDVHHVPVRRVEAQDVPPAAQYDHSSVRARVPTRAVQVAGDRRSRATAREPPGPPTRPVTAAGHRSRT